MPDEELYARHQTYLNYLTALSRQLARLYSDPSVLVQQIRGTTQFARISSRAGVNHEQISYDLRNAWLTEIQLSLCPADPRHLPYATQWAPVKLYYAVYLASRAYLAATGQQVNENHAAALSAMSNQISQRPGLFPIPWRVLCSAGTKPATATYLHLPDGASVQRGSSLSSSQSTPFWDSFGMLLRTTRGRQVERKVLQRKRDIRSGRLPKGERERIEASLSPTSLFDALYRLRLRSNYADADAFLAVLPSAIDAVELQRSAVSIGFYTLLVLEVLIARYIGMEAFRAIRDQFARWDHCCLASESLERRFPLLN